jgi:acylphosphatase
MKRVIGRMVAVRFEVTGRVQGVGFRAYVQKHAHQNGLAGWVRNDESGSVLGYAEGDVISMQRFVDALNPGPPNAKVETVDTMEETPIGTFRTFDIRR